MSFKKLDSSVDYSNKAQCSYINYEAFMVIEHRPEVKVVECDNEELNHYGIKFDVGDTMSIHLKEYIPLDVYKLPNHLHDYNGCPDASNGNLYACFQHEEPNENTLKPFDLYSTNVWRYEILPDVYAKEHYFRNGYKYRIYRGDRLFKEGWFGDEERAYRECKNAIAFFNNFDATDMRMRNWRTNLSGEIIKWKGLYLTIDYVIEGQANLITKERVTVDGEFDTLKLCLMDPLIDWYIHEDDVPFYGDAPKEPELNKAARGFKSISKMLSKAFSIDDFRITSNGRSDTGFKF